MRIEIIDGAGKRITDGSAIALAVLAVVPAWLALVPESAPTWRDYTLIAVAVLGWAFKFIRVVP